MVLSFQDMPKHQPLAVARCGNLRAGLTRLASDRLQAHRLPRRSGRHRAFRLMFWNALAAPCEVPLGSMFEPVDFVAGYWLVASPLPPRFTWRLTRYLVRLAPS
jgi:hypothetical protein